MKKTSGARSLLLFAVLCAVSGFLLRAAFLNGSKALYLILASAAVAAVILVKAISLLSVDAITDLFKPSVPALIAGLLGAAALLVGGVMFLAEGAELMEKVLALLSVIAAACMAFFVLNVQNGKKQSAVMCGILTLFYVVKLFYDFRRWMHDPAVLDYCFWLFAAISFMLCAYHLTEGCTAKCKRQRIAFFSLCGIFFGMVSLTDLSGSDLIQMAGSTLFALSCAWQVTENRSDAKEEIPE